MNRPRSNNPKKKNVEDGVEQFGNSVAAGRNKNGNMMKRGDILPADSAPWCFLSLIRRMLNLWYIKIKIRAV